MPNLTYPTQGFVSAKSLSNLMTLLGCCLIAINCLGDSNQSVGKKSAQKISSDFLEFLDEFSDDEDSVVQLLAEDSDGNILIDGANTQSHKLNDQPEKTPLNFHNRTMNQSISSASASSVGGEKK